MRTEDVQSIKLSNVSQKIMFILMEHAERGSKLETELIELLEVVKEEQKKADDIKALMYEIASKM